MPTAATRQVDDALGGDVTNISHEFKRESYFSYFLSPAGLPILTATTALLPRLSKF
jgi:hypothetical protein